MKVGHGYDIHRLVEGRKLILGGIEIPFQKGPDAHSDGDVLVHALIDAILGAAGKGDIGKHFPNTPKYKNADSMKLLDYVMQLVAEREWKVTNIDATIIAEKPKLGKFVAKMKENIAKTVGIEASMVNIKAATNEGLDAIGEGRAIAAHAVVIIQLVPRSRHPFQLS
ncbi:MAG: 2-C-methyl-D-erythritol 2,4-cyclodiphosphate synthase [Deltaproteobacteria bacterium]|nr:2-C-methyl-D-erythritol 2,4-cyclodiphosphate synthase [Deltaproteobacteria bacterium]